MLSGASVTAAAAAGQPDSFPILLMPPRCGCNTRRCIGKSCAELPPHSPHTVATCLCMLLPQMVASGHCRQLRGRRQWQLLKCSSVAVSVDVVALCAILNGNYVVRFGSKTFCVERAETTLWSLLWNMAAATLEGCSQCLLAALNWINLTVKCK